MNKKKMLLLNFVMNIFVILLITIQSSDAVHDDEEMNDFEDNDHYDDTTSEEMDNTIPLESIPEKDLTSHEHWASSNANGTIKIYSNIRPNKYEQYPTFKYKKNLKKKINHSSMKEIPSHYNSASKNKNIYFEEDTEIAKEDMKKDTNKLSKKYSNLSSHEVKVTQKKNKQLKSKTFGSHSEADVDFKSVSNEHTRRVQNKVTEEKEHIKNSDNEIKRSTEDQKDTIADLESSNEEEDEEEETTERTEDENIEQRTKETEKDKNEGPKGLKFPYTVSVQKRNSHYASGALLSPRWVISSGREFYNVRESIKLFQVRYGTVNCKRGPTVPIMNIVMHPGYHSPSYDLSLLKMASEVTSVMPIPLGSKYDSEEIYVTTYWARLIINGTVLPNNAKERFKSHSLRVSKQNHIPYSWCKEELKREGVNLTFASFCLKPIVEHHSKCLQDPGAPVVFNNSLHGITSGWSGSCYDGPRVTVVAAITQDLMKEWIVGTISG